MANPILSKEAIMLIQSWITLLYLKSSGRLILSITDVIFGLRMARKVFRGLRRRSRTLGGESSSRFLR
jgi:hypothetical protein